MNSLNAECVLATADVTSLLLEFIGRAVWPWIGRMSEDRLRGEFQKTMGHLDMDIRSPWIHC